jgi:hypothetical protein
MLTRRTLVASSAVLAAGCGPLGSLLTAPSSPKEAELTWVTFDWFIGLVNPGTGAGLRPEEKYQNAVSALADDKENPHGQNRGKYRLTLRHVEQLPELGEGEFAGWLDDLEADLLTVGPEGARALGEEGVLLPLDQFIASDGADLEQAFYPSLLEQFRQGELYALPVDARPLMLYYDVDYFALEEVSTPAGDNWDWGDLLESALNLTRRREDGSVSRWGLAAHGSQLWWALWQNEADVLDSETLQCRLQEPAAIEALQFVHGLLHTHRVSPAALYTDLSKLVFEPARFAPAMVYSSPPIRPPGHYHLAELPLGKVHSVPMYGDLGIGIVARTEKPEAAYTALKGLVDVMQQFVHVPAKKEAVARLKELRTDLHPEDVVAIQRSMDHGRAGPRSVPALFAMDSLLQGIVRGDSLSRVVNEACSITHEYQQA